MKNLIKYVIGLPLLIVISFTDILIFILDIGFDFIIKGEIDILELQVTKDLLKETWRPIK